MKLKKLFKWKRIKRWLSTGLILTLIVGGAVALNNTFNDDGITILKTKTIELNDVEFKEISQATVSDGESSEHKIYMAYETEDFIVLAYNCMSVEQYESEDFEFKFGMAYSTDPGFLFVLSQNKILDVSLPEYDMRFTGGYVQANNPSSGASQAVWDVKDYIDLELSSEFYQIDCYAYELDLSNAKYNNNPIDDLKILFG